MGIVSKVIGGIASPLFDVIDEFVEDKDQRNKLKQALQTRMIESKDKRFQAAADIVEAEVKKGGMSAWRAALMWVFIAIIANNFILTPYLNAIFGAGIKLDMPSDMWNILMASIGGYVNVKAGVQGVKAHKRGKIEEEKVRRGLYDNAQTEKNPS